MDGDEVDETSPVGENASPKAPIGKLPGGLGGADADAADNEDGNNIINNKEIAFIFKSNRDDHPEKAYYDDGNPELYSDDKLAKRKALKSDPDVMSAIKEFMTSSFSFTPQKIVTKDQYMQKFTKIGQILRPNTEAEELQKLVKEDYDVDNENNQQDTVDEEKLYDSLFELADLW